MGSSHENDNKHIEELDDFEEEQLCLKLHRLGRTCFRKVSMKDFFSIEPHRT